MPTAPPRPCPHPGCGALVPGGGRCPTHNQQQRQAIDTARGSAARRGYDATWRKVRLHQLQGEPLCRLCRESGMIVPADVVDHIDGNSRNNAPGNLRSLCKPCHDRRTGRDQAFGRKKIISSNNPGGM